MKTLQVIYRGWGAQWPLGLLADTGRDILFEYSTDAIAHGLQLSPLHHPLPRAGAATATFKGEPHFQGLPGFVADALPDGWGMLLMDRAIRQAGRNPHEVSVLERLAIVGDRALGALSFEPAQNEVLPSETLDLIRLAADVAALQTESHTESDATSIDDRLRHLMQLGGSPQGARPKVLADFNQSSGQLSSALPTAATAKPWLFKFPAQGEHTEVCALEELYARIARKMGIEMPSSQFFELGKQHSAFGVERFDRVVNGTNLLRVPVMSLSAYVQSNFRLPSLDYETLLLATLRITGDQREVVKAFERCVFNVLMHNRDDHGKNFAFRMDEQGLWKLAPAFDLTYSVGPGGQHSTTVAGHGRNISRDHLLQVAKTSGVPVKLANDFIDQAVQVTGEAQTLVGDLPIRKSTLEQWVKTIRACAELVRRRAI